MKLTEFYKLPIGAKVFDYSGKPGSKIYGSKISDSAIQWPDEIETINKSNQRQLLYVWLVKNRVPMNGQNTPMLR